MASTATLAQWRRFAQYIVEGETQTQAAILCGYSPSRAQITGSELMARPEVQQLVTEIGGQRAISVRVESAWDAGRVIRELEATAREARGSENHTAAVRAYELIGKHIGMWPRTPDNIDARQVNFDLSGLSTEELRAMLSGMASQRLAIDSPTSD